MSSSWLEQSIPSTNTYVIDAKSATAQARLIDQETLLTEAMGGPPPEQSAQALEHIHDVLDIGCGPGGWVHTVAQTYPQTQATGIDVSTTMITYAQAIAHLCYKGYAFIPPSLQEIAALFARWRPDVGGSVQSYKRRHLGITPMLGSWFYQTGYQQVQQIPTAIEVSAGTQAHPCFTLQVETFIRQITPFLLAMRVVTEEAYERLCVQVKAEVQQDTFCGLCFMLSVFGQRPGSENAAPL